MKSFFALALFVGVIYCNSTAYYGWAPHKQLTYRFESQVLTGIPNVRQQYAGLKLSSNVKIQTFNDYTLRIQFENPRFIQVNDELEVRDGRPQVPKATQELPETLRRPLTETFLVNLKRGVVEEMFVERNEPVVVTNIKKALLSQLQLDLTASRRAQVQQKPQQNNNGWQTVNNKQEQPLNPESHTYFTTEESTLVGDCQTSYTIHQLPQYQAQELEQRIARSERQLSQAGVIEGEQSQGEEACRGKEYFKITKTKNFDNCKERSIYQSIIGMKSICDFSKASCKDLMTQMSTSQYIVCGNPQEFLIREAETNNEVLTNPLGWNTTPEKMTTSAKVTLMLLNVKSSGFNPLPKPQNPEKKSSLNFEFPKNQLWGSKSQSRDISPRQETDGRGYQPILPMPDMKSGSSLFPQYINFNELRQKIAQEMKQIVQEIYKSPESCSSKSDIAGYISAISFNIRPLSFVELEEIESTIHQLSLDHEEQQIAKDLWFDMLSMSGSNPSIALIKQKVESRQMTKSQAAKVIQAAIRNVRTPTKQLLQELLQLVKNVKEQGQGQQQQHLYNNALIQLSNLVRDACVDPNSRITQFPVRTYGLFCTQESEFITREFIPYMTQELKNARSESEMLIVVSALGKVAHKDILLTLVEVIEGKHQAKSPLSRSVAVYSLKKLAKIEPSVVRPILLALIDNPAENTEVRIAAVSVLPWTQPSTANLQKIAMRSWFEPSTQVASFIYSTFQSLEQTNIPELKSVGEKVQGLKSLIKPFQYGIQFSHNSHTQKFVEYLRTVSSVETTYVNTAKNLFPAKLSFSSQLYGGAWEINGLTFNMYTKGMDTVIDKLMDYVDWKSEVSSEVKQQLEQITQKLDIQQREKDSPQAFLQFGMLGMDRVYSLDKSVYSEILEKVSEQLRSNPEMFSSGQFNYTHAQYAIDIDSTGPTDAGFPIVITRNMPIVFGIKGEYKAEGSFMSKSNIQLLTKPVINAKVQSNMGIISPFTKQFVGAGVELSLHMSMPISVQAEMSRRGEVAIALKTPEQMQHEFEVLHLQAKPYTVIKSLEKLQPVTKSSSVKEILSGNDLKQVDLDIGRSIGVDAKLQIQADYKELNFAYIWEKLSQHNIQSLVSLSSMMSPTVRSSSLKIVYNPQNSQTKEFETRINIVHGKKVEGSSTPSMVFGEESRQGEIQEIKEICQMKHQQSHKVERCIEKKIGESQSRQESYNVAQNMLEKINVGSATGLKVRTSFHSQSSSRTLETTVIYGSEQLGGHTQSEQKKQWLDIQVQQPNSSPYEIKLEALTENAEMPIRWNLREMIQQDLKMQTKLNIVYGKKDSEKSQVELDAVLSKSEHQKRAVSNSPELKKCEQEMSKGQKLSSVCEETRHQAASVDKIWLKVRVPQSWEQSQLWNKIGEATKAYLWPVLREDSQERQQQSKSGLFYEVNAYVNRQGDAVSGEVQTPYSKMQVTNASVPQSLRKVFPLSLRNGVELRLLQVESRDQAPASCRIDNEQVSSFDNKTYRYELNDCEHLLFKDCSSFQVKRPLAVLARKENNSQKKIVKILSGRHIVELQGKESQQVKIIVNGQEEQVPTGTKVVKRSHQTNQIDLTLYRNQDGVVSVTNPIDSLQVFFDGHQIEVVAPQILHNRACGLCGDLNGENTADLKTPKQCLTRSSRLSAYSYMLKDGQNCQGIPSQDRAAYEKEIRECSKTHSIYTPLEQLARQTIQKKIQHKSQLKHVVEVQENDVCISKSRVRMCARGETPRQVRQVELSFTCMTRGYSKTQQLAKRAQAGEEVPEVKDMPTRYSKKHSEATACSQSDNQQQQQNNQEQSNQQERRQEQRDEQERRQEQNEQQKPRQEQREQQERRQEQREQQERRQEQRQQQERGQEQREQQERHQEQQLQNGDYQDQLNQDNFSFEQFEEMIEGEEQGQRLHHNKHHQRQQESKRQQQHEQQKRREQQQRQEQREEQQRQEQRQRQEKQQRDEQLQREEQRRNQKNYRSQSRDNDLF